jgi:hypothetical protein
MIQVVHPGSGSQHCQQIYVLCLKRLSTYSPLPLNVILGGGGAGGRRVSYSLPADS